MPKPTVGRQHAEQAFRDQYGGDAEQIMQRYADKVAAPSVQKLPPAQRLNRVFAKGNQQTPGKGGLKKR
jgi:hypothetical protein